MKLSTDYNENVFINCSFDLDYKPLFDAVVFTVFDCGFIARCALEEGDASQIRLEKIYVLIANCRYGVHDISRVELDDETNLPRFNMPFELGLFLSAKKFGSIHQQKKSCLIMDREQHRYHKFISDISGQDVEAHGNQPSRAVEITRNWLRGVSRRTTIQGGSAVWEDYDMFKVDLPAMCDILRLDPNSLTYNDYILLVTVWLEAREEKLLYAPGLDMPPTELIGTDLIGTVKVTSRSKAAAQKRLDEDTKRVGYVRGELYQLEDGSWGIHWGGKYPL